MWPQNENSQFSRGLDCHKQNTSDIIVYLTKFEVDVWWLPEASKDQTVFRLESWKNQSLHPIGKMMLYK